MCWCGRLPLAGHEPLRGVSSTPRVPPASSGRGCAATSPVGQAGAVWCHGRSRKAAALSGDIPDLGSADSSVDLNSSSHAGPEESGSLELDPPLEPESPAPSAEEEEEEEEAADSCPETSAAPEGESEEAAPLSTSAAGKAKSPCGRPPPASAPKPSVLSSLSQVMAPAGASPPRRRCAFPCSMGTWCCPPPSVLPRGRPAAPG